MRLEIGTEWDCIVKRLTTCSVEETAYVNCILNLCFPQKKLVKKENKPTPKKPAMKVKKEETKETPKKRVKKEPEPEIPVWKWW